MSMSMNVRVRVKVRVRVSNSALKSMHAWLGVFIASCIHQCKYMWCVCLYSMSM